MLLLGFGEELAQVLLGFAVPFGDQLRAADREEARARLVGHRPGQKGLAASGWVI